MKKAAKETTPTKKSSTPTQPKSPLLQCEDKTRIFIRIRPLLNTEEWNANLTVKDNNHIRMIKSDFESVQMRFEGIFAPTFLQKDIFSTLEPSIKGFLNGENHSFFAYGQTGAGKTYTMMGDFEEKATDYTKFLTNDSRGILPRALTEILHYLQNRKCRLWAAFYEIYNDKIYDLLNAKSRQKKGGLEFRENVNGANVIIDLQQFEINGVNDMLDCLRVGIQNRVTGSTHGNQKSSRSHSIFQLKLVQADPQDAAKTMISQLKIVDLAGSEKFIIPQNLTSEERELRITELTSINGSLSTLGLCVSALTEPNRSHIPLRNSKLTRVLSDTLNGSSKITFVVCISPSKESNNETLSTLQFANRAKKIVLEGRATSKATETKKVSSMNEHGLLQEMCNIDIVKKNIPLEVEIQQLRQQNEELKDQLKKMERSCSPLQRQYASAGKSLARRSVSPISSSVRTQKDMRDALTPTKKSESRARVQTSAGKDLDVKTVNKNRNMESKSSTVVVNKVSRTNTEPQYDTQPSRSPFRSKSGINNDHISENQLDDDLFTRQGAYYSTDVRKGIKREEIYKPNSYSKMRLTSTPIDEASPQMAQQRLLYNSSPTRQKTPDYRDQPSGGSNLCEWGIQQDSRCLRESEQMGLPEMSAILPIHFNSCSSSETEAILGSQGEPMKRIQEENNVSSNFLTTKLQNTYTNGQQRVANLAIDDSVEAHKSSVDFGGEIIKEFNRKLSSVQELNQQHKNLVQNLSNKIGTLHVNTKKGESRSASKSPNHYDKQVGKNDPKKISQSATKIQSNGYNSAGLRGQRSSDMKPYSSVQGKYDSGNSTRLISTHGMGSATTTNTTGYSERKSDFLESKSIMDIISKHWETYKDNIK